MVVDKNGYRNYNFDFSKHIAWQLERSNNFIYIVNKKNDKDFMLKDIGKDIWLMLEKKFSVYEIVTKFVEEYNEEYNLIYSDVMELLNDLYKEGLVVKNEA